MTLPLALLDSLEGLPGFDRQAFEAVHAAGESLTSIRINPRKMQGDPAAYFSTLNESISTEQVPWTTMGWYLSERPSFTFDPLFHAGCYYVQEASSMFLEQAFAGYVDARQPMRVLDLSAAPGGKSTHVQSILPTGSLLVSNEVIRSRASILADNIIKWGASNVIVTNDDPSSFKKLPGFFDLIIVDAPCSGSGLFRKDPDAVKEWSPANVDLCSQRQQRILADVLPALRTGGLLVYSTCSYSKEEDELIGDWLIRDFAMEPLALHLDEKWQVIHTESGAGAHGYRFYPDKLKGEGFYLSCFRQVNGREEGRYKTGKTEKATAKELSALGDRLDLQGYFTGRNYRGLFAFPEHLSADLFTIRGALHTVYEGVQLGEVMKDRLVPDHALALAPDLQHQWPCWEVEREEAIRYLQRNEMHTQPGQKGWQTVQYKGHSLGWINALPNRINNYYPKELRILKQHDGASEK